MDVAELIRTAKIGSERRFAQEETCAVFAAALYDVLVENGLKPKMVVAAHKGFSSSNTWYHSVVKLDGVLYDSLGEFSTEIVRKRLKIHPRVSFELEFKQDRREGCYEEVDYDVLHAFFVKAFRKALLKMRDAEIASDLVPTIEPDVPAPMGM